MNDTNQEIKITKLLPRRMKKIIIFLFAIMILSPLLFHPVTAHPPEKITLFYDISSNILNVNITHVVSNTVEHYIEKITIEKNGDHQFTKYYDLQPSTSTFTYSYFINANSGDKITVTAYCIIAGSLNETITIPFDEENQPPNRPTIDGPFQGRTNVEYSFTFCSTDPDGDSIYYCIDWGDGSEEICVRPFPSGACVTISHSWDTYKTYKITVVAKDTKHAESDPATHSITLPKSKINHRTNLRSYLLDIHSNTIFYENNILQRIHTYFSQLTQILYKLC